jgi:hypothetical protein
MPLFTVPAPAVPAPDPTSPVEWTANGYAWAVDQDRRFNAQITLTNELNASNLTDITGFGYGATTLPLVPNVRAIASLPMPACR